MDANHAKSRWVSYNMPEQSMHACMPCAGSLDIHYSCVRHCLLCARVHAAKLLGFDDFVPPFSGASSQQLLRGANFASAAAGIREETGQQLVYIRLYARMLIQNLPRPCMHDV